MLRTRDVLAVVPVSRVTLWNWRRQGHFPAPVRLGPNLLFWRESDVLAWLAANPEARRREPGPDEFAERTKAQLAVAHRKDRRWGGRRG
jgi:prophage regulatory protein